MQFHVNLNDIKIDYLWYIGLTDMLYFIYVFPIFNREDITLDYTNVQNRAEMFWMLWGQMPDLSQ